MSPFQSEFEQAVEEVDKVAHYCDSESEVLNQIYGAIWGVLLDTALRSRENDSNVDRIMLEKWGMFWNIHTHTYYC
jgi:hypothetical protein